MRQKYTDTSNALEEVKRELKNIGEIYSTDNLFETCDSIEAIWEQLFPAERYNLAHLLIDRVTLFSDHILIDVNHYGIRSLIRDLKSSGSGTESIPTENNEIIRLKIPAIIKHWNGRKLIITPEDSDEKNLCTVDGEENSVTKCLAQAHRWLEMIDSGEYPTVARLAEGYNLDPSNLMKALKMTTLSPKIQERIISGDIPDTMTLTKFYSEFPEKSRNIISEYQREGNRMKLDLKKIEVILSLFQHHETRLENILHYYSTGDIYFFGPLSP